MEGREGSGFDGALMKRRRSSSAARRPRPEGGPAAADQRENTSPSSSMSSRSGSRRLPAEDGGLRRREFHLNDPSLEGGLRSSSKTKGGTLDSSTGDKPKKLKLKISMVPKPNPDAQDSRSSPVKPPRPGDSRHQLKNGDEAEGVKDSGRSTSSRDKKARKERSIETLAREQPNNVQREPTSDPVRKSRRLAKKSVLDSELDDDYSRNLEDLGTSEDILEPKNKAGSSSKKNASKKAKRSSKLSEIDNDFVASRSNKDGKKRSRESTDGDNSEEEPTSDSELDAEDEKQESPANVRSGALTTRRRALQSWMDGNSSSTIEFPDGLPPAPSRGKKDKLSGEEMLAKKAEAAQRRKMQVEKATKESEAEAIRKILGLDSDKKKEERKQKEREEKERAIRAQNLAGSTIRWVMGPTGTIVSFPHAIGLPSIFNSKPHSYPPPREKCAGPSCTNAYRYRDSKLNLPLCSLKCYKAVHGNA
ncbi:hypothetical protein ACP70R_033468 [Stipagrostis hirtigluma subsp. patula]